MSASAPPMFHQPMSIGRLLDEAMRHTRSGFFNIYPAVAIPIALANGLWILLQSSRMGRFMEATDSGMFAEVAVQWLMLLSLGLAFGFGVWIGINAMLVGALQHVGGHQVQMGRNVGWLLQPRVLAILLLCYLAQMLGLFMCFLPGIFCAVLFGLVVPVMASEGILGFAAIGRASDLIFNNPQRRLGTHPFFRLLLILFVGYLVSMVVGWIVQLPFMIVSWIHLWRSAAGGEMVTNPAFMYQGWMLVLQVIQGMISMLGTLAVIVYVWNCVALFYQDLRARREGGDLAGALDAAGVPPALGEAPR